MLGNDTRVEFISEVKNYERITLGEVERRFLATFSVSSSVKNALSAYDIFLRLKKRKPMAYNNVNTRVRRLHDLRLIQMVDKEGGYKRGAKKYRLTSRGLFEILMLEYNYRPAKISCLTRYKDNVIMKTIVYEHFEDETIQNLRGDALWLITDYVGKCCASVLEILERYRINPERYGPKIDEYRALVISDLINSEIKDFVTNIVTSSNLNEDLFPIKILAKDEKFMSILMRMKKDLEGGFKKFIRASARS